MRHKKKELKRRKKSSFGVEKTIKSKSGELLRLFVDDDKIFLFVLKMGNLNWSGRGRLMRRQKQGKKTLKNY